MNKVIGRFIFDASSEYIIESKSLKLYLNSFNCTKFDNKNVVADLIANDLSQNTNTNVRVELFDVEDECFFTKTKSTCIDGLEINIPNTKDVDRSLLIPPNSLGIINERLYSNLFKSNCLVTLQPDWATIFIEYLGPPIDHGGFLKYLISYRNHKGFHEQCVERVYVDLMNTYRPLFLSVYAKYTRRGGIDICPYRATKMTVYPDLNRINRQ